MKKKLRVGLLVDDLQLPAWAIKMVKQIHHSDYAEMVLVIQKTNPQPAPKSFLYNLINLRSGKFYYLFEQFENRIFKPTPNAFQTSDLREVVDCRVMEVTVEEIKYSDHFSTSDIENIQSHEIDVLIRIGFRTLRGDILNCAKYGVWSYHHGDHMVNRGGPAGVWEVLEDWDETGVTLHILTEDLLGGNILYKTSGFTDGLSINRSRNNYFWKAASFLPRKLEELYKLGESSFFEQVETDNADPLFYYNRLYTLPTNAEIFKIILKKYLEAMKRKVSNLFYFDQWILLYKFENNQEVSNSFYDFKRITPPKDRFWADPFIIEKNQRYYIFMEELLFQEQKGKISVITLDEEGNYDSPVVVLDKPYHLSYPLLLEEEGALYMLPETSDNGTIEIYKCVDFPYKWDLHKVLMTDIRAVDTTILKHDNKYWMFTNILVEEVNDGVGELFLFYADDLFSDHWTPHPMNPLSTDIKTARPAGNILLHKNKMYRISQNCQNRYGYGMNTFEITQLDEQVYQEKLVQSIYPNWAKDVIATHTLNHHKNLTIIDAELRRRK